jgi:hypothetical protein
MVLFGLNSLSPHDKLALLEKPEEGQMRLFVRIQGLSPIQLHQHKGLSVESYIDIVNQYYINLYSGKPPGPLYPHKIVNFNNGDKLLEFRRKETLALKFCMEVQNKTPIYDEPAPCKESITMMASPVPDICEYQLPRFISLNRLLLMITDPWSDGILLKVFWYTYRTFTKPRVVLTKIIERFDVPPLNPAEMYTDKSSSTPMLDIATFSYIDETYFNTEIKRKIQEIVAQMLYEWVTKYYFDFDDKMVQQLENFVQNRLIPSGFIGLASKISNSMRETPRIPNWQRVTVLQLDQKLAKNPKLVKMMGVPDSVFNIMDVTDQEIADTLTQMDHQRYDQIKFTEMLEQAWNKEKKRHMAPNIMNNINFLNKVSSWVAYTILAEDSIPNRKKLIKKFVRIMLLLKKHHSFNMLLALNAGMNNSAVHRLSHTWLQVSEKIQELRKKVVEVISSQNNSTNFKQLRSLMNKLYERGVPCSPYLGIYLRDLVFTEDANATYVDGKINMQKFIITYNTMHQVLRFQGRDYQFSTPSTAFMREINSFKIVNDDTLFDMSLKTQPKEKPNVPK